MTANAKKYYEDLPALPASGTPVVMAEIGKRKYQAELVTKWLDRATDQTLVSGVKVAFNVGGANKTATLPATIVEGDEFIAHCYTYTATTNLLTINRNGHTIRYAANHYYENVTLKPGETIHLVALSSTLVEIV